MPWPSDSVLTLQPHPYGKAAFEKVGVRVMSIWWRRWESNPEKGVRHDKIWRVFKKILIFMRTPVHVFLHRCRKSVL